jgi:ATP-dependent RNA helicase MSS116, mitochondrial
LLFSATSSMEIQRLIRACVKPNHKLVDCIDEEDPASHTNAIVEQSHIVLPTDRLVTGIVQVLEHLANEPNLKVMVFFPTTAQVSFFAQLFNRGIGTQVLSIHAKMRQSVRTNTSDQFRHAKRGFLFTTDVSARGVDYPDVTHVIQVGVASDRESYIHRLGRTGRSGKNGKGLVMLTEHELPFVSRELKGLAVPVHSDMQALVRGSLSPKIEEDMMRIAHKIRQGAGKAHEETAKLAYASMLGFYSLRLKTLGGKSVDPLVAMANGFAVQAGLHEVPELTEAQAERFGIKYHPQVNICKRWPVGGIFDVGNSSVRNNRRWSPNRNGGNGSQRSY